MSVACGIECVVCIGFTRWAWKRLTYIGAYDSESWPLASAADFAPVPRICRLILAIYEPDLSSPRLAPPGGYRLNPSWLVKRATVADTGNNSPPYLIYVDCDHKEIVLAVRGLNLARRSDYKTLYDNRLGGQMFDGGYVHHGLHKSAQFLLERETDTLRSLIDEHGKDYSLVFAGHSLGSGIAALMTVLAVNRRKAFGNMPRNQIRCYAFAPARCMSLNLAVKYADVINSVILQDDFLPRTPTPLEHIFGSIFCLPCLLFLVCLRDTFKQDKRKLRDPRRLYAPGKIYHIVERKFCRCGRFPPEVRTAIPVEGRFEHVVLSCTTTSDHGILWIAREAEKALNLMIEREEPSTAPPLVQKMERQQSLLQEHRDALQKAVTLQVPHAVLPPPEEPSEQSDSAAVAEPGSLSGRTHCDAPVDRLFDRSESGNIALEKDAAAAAAD